MKTYKKIDDNTIEVTKTPVVKPTTAKYEVGYLKSQRENIIKQRDEFVAQRDLELAEVQLLIDKCKELNITEEVTPINPMKP